MKISPVRFQGQPSKIRFGKITFFNNLNELSPSLAQQWKDKLSPFVKKTLLYDFLVGYDTTEKQVLVSYKKRNDSSKESTDKLFEIDDFEGAAAWLGKSIGI